jgi:hypothetical protein
MTASVPHPERGTGLKDHAGRWVPSALFDSELIAELTAMDQRDSVDDARRAALMAQARYRGLATQTQPQEKGG